MNWNLLTPHHGNSKASRTINHILISASCITLHEHTGTLTLIPPHTLCPWLTVTSHVLTPLPLWQFPGDRLHDPVLLLSSPLLRSAAEEPLTCFHTNAEVTGYGHHRPGRETVHLRRSAAGQRYCQITVSSAVYWNTER